MRALFALALAVLLASFQAAALHHLGGGAIPVSLTLPIVVYMGVHAGNIEGAFAAAAVGYVLDVMTGGPKGLMTSLAVALFLFSRAVTAALSIQGRLGFSVLCGVGTFLYGTTALVVIRLVTPGDAAPGPALVGRILVEAIATALVAPLISTGLQRAEGLFSRDEPGLLR